MGNVILGILLVGYIVVTIVNLVIEVKRDKETRPLRIRAVSYTHLTLPTT